MLKRSYLEPAIRGDLIACLGATEADAGSDTSGKDTAWVIENPVGSLEDIFWFFYA